MRYEAAAATGHVCRSANQHLHETDSQKVWCLRCGLCQFPRENCLRCKSPLPKVEVVAEPRVIRERVEVACPRCGLFSADAPLPTLREAEQMLIEEAMRRAHGQPGEASRILGIGRTTLYRRLHPEKVGR